MQWLQTCSLIGAVLYVRIDQAMGATENRAIETGATAVIHVGPHKTASKSVQADLHDHEFLLNLDGWKLVRPQQFGLAAPEAIQVANAAACYSSKEYHKTTWFTNKTDTCPNWLEYIAQLKDTTIGGGPGGEVRRGGPSQKARKASGLLRSFPSFPRRHKKPLRRREGF